MIGKIVSHYKILEHLGGGGMGVVYKAQDLTLDRFVALKVLPPDLIREPEARERFLREARAASALDHPNICTIYEAGETNDGLVFIAMACYDGETLKKKIERGAVPIREAVEIAVQIAKGLQKAHELGIIHRDIKPANIIVTNEGVVKIVDFGLAKLRGQSLLTQPGWTPGTIAYMSPEQAVGGKVDHRTDLWSLGVVLYEMLSGQRPFAGDVEEALVYAIRNDEPRPLRDVRPEIPAALAAISKKTVAKRLDDRYASAAEVLRNLRRYQDSSSSASHQLLNPGRLMAQIRKPRFVFSGVVLLCGLVGTGAWYSTHQAKVRMAREDILPRAIALKGPDADIYDNVAAYKLAEEAEQYIPGDPALEALFASLSVPVTVRSDPAGAKVFLKEYGAPDSTWRFIGTTPIEHVRMPIWFFEVRMEKEGYDPVLAATLVASYSRGGWTPDTVARTLSRSGVIPDGMVRVPGYPDVPGIGALGDFYLDRYEVTNKSYKEFVDNGGYQKREFWKHPFIRDGKAVAWETAMKAFVDQTGRPGPGTWQAGGYPVGQDDFPVSGVCWYEAAAFAEFAGKTLPTVYHWDIASGVYTRLNHSKIFAALVLASFNNLRGVSPAPVGRFGGITAYGNFDMSGNVREWCWNESQKGRVTRGGAWDDVPYMFDYWSQAPAFDRSPKNGFRCARYISSETMPAKIYGRVHAKEHRDYYEDKPVPDAIFQIYKDQFTYDNSPLDGRVEWRKDSAASWILEKVSFNAAYDNERIPAYLFLPSHVKPPYQTVVYFPGGILSAMLRSSNNIERDRDFVGNIRFLLQSGRAVLYPVYKGTFERGSDELLRIHTGDTTHQFSAYCSKLIKDFKRSVDYLETRPEIDRTRIAYFGWCWGGYIGTIITAVENRITVSVLRNAGFWDFSRPEVNEFNYVPRVKIPTLILNGRYDPVFPLEASVKPMYDLLGTAPVHKKLVLYEADHYLPENESIRETLDWLDRYLGPVH